MNISTQKAFRTGLNGSYSTDTVRGTSELSDTNGFNGSLDSTYTGRYKETYMPNPVLLGQPNYQNPETTLHNNIGNNVLLESLFDNKIYIDSGIRDFTKQPDPYRFTVKFNGTEPKTESESINIEDETFSYTRYVQGDTDILINKIFRNIKSVTIDALIMPSCINFRTDEYGRIVKNDTRLGKHTYKYIILKINELTNGRCYSNNKELGKETFIMNYDTELCHNNQLWVPIRRTVAYPDSQLNIIDRLNIEVCDDTGHRLVPTLDGKNYDFFGEYYKLINKIKLSKQVDEIELLRLKSLKCIISYLSPELHMTFMTREPQINTNPQYRH
jgi:hypothetical protein